MGAAIGCRARVQMVERQLVRVGISDARVLAAMGKVPRHLFVPEHLADLAYEDQPLPIGCRQTISQPLVVALMTEALLLEGAERVLEVGTGSGYAAAVLGEAAAEVYTIERIKKLADRAEATLRTLGYQNVHVRCGDGTLGWPDHAPYDGIVVTAGGPNVPSALKEQLAVGGRLVMPVDKRWGIQSLVRLTRRSEQDFEIEDLGGVKFVPLIGEQGWPPSDQRDPIDEAAK